MKFNPEDYPTHNFEIDKTLYSSIKTAKCINCNIYLEYIDSDYNDRSVTLYCEGRMIVKGGTITFDIEKEITETNKLMTCEEYQIKKLLE